MPDDKRTPASGEDRGYTPSSPVKRTLAWTGLAYMVILVAMTTYPYLYRRRAGATWGPCSTVPGLIGLGAAALVSWRTAGKPGKWSAVALAALCWLLALATLPIGIAGLMSNFGG